MLHLLQTLGPGRMDYAQDLWLMAIVVALAGGVVGAARSGLDTRVAFNAGVAAVLAGLVGGRLWLLLLTPGVPASSQSWDLLGGDKSVMGALLGAGFGAWAALASMRRPALPYLDAAMPWVCAAYAIGRLGCLLAGCCYGTPTQLAWGTSVPQGMEAYAAQQAAGLLAPGAPASLPVHPVALLHAALGATLATAAWRPAMALRAAHGRLTAATLGAYALARFGIEALRGDALATWLGLSVAQIGCIALLALAALIWHRSGGRRRIAWSVPTTG